MTLRDELERKLRGIYVASKNDVFGEIADEVIRQMEWARRECPRRSINDGWGKIDMGWDNLTVAPEDWKP